VSQDLPEIAEEDLDWISPEVAKIVLARAADGSIPVRYDPDEDDI
jgi:hypothetical protein